MRGEERRVNVVMKNLSIYLSIYLYLSIYIPHWREVRKAIDTRVCGAITLSCPLAPCLFVGEYTEEGLPTPSLRSLCHLVVSSRPPPRPWLTPTTQEYDDKKDCAQEKSVSKDMQSITHTHTHTRTLSLSLSLSYLSLAIRGYVGAQ